MFSISSSFIFNIVWQFVYTSHSLINTRFDLKVVLIQTPFIFLWILLTNSYACDYSVLCLSLRIVLLLLMFVFARSSTADVIVATGDFHLNLFNLQAELLTCILQSTTNNKCICSFRFLALLSFLRLFLWESFFFLLSRFFILANAMREKRWQTQNFILNHHGYVIGRINIDRKLE